jgi:DNA-binding MarR family transcriptional regulator
MSEDRDPVAAWQAVLRAQNRALRAIEQDLHDQGLIPLSWYDVLLELNAAPGRQLRMQDLAARVVLSRTRVSRLVSELERVGYIERVPDPDDGRATLARITAEGRTARRQAAPAYLTGIEKHFSRHLTAAQQDAVAKGLQRVIDAHEVDPRR